MLPDSTGFIAAIVSLILIFAITFTLWAIFIEYKEVVAPKLYKVGTLVRIDGHTGIYIITEVYENTFLYYVSGVGKYWYKAPRKVTHDEIHSLKPISRRR
jgi:hypothetical protein